MTTTKTKNIAKVAAAKKTTGDKAPRLPRKVAVLKGASEKNVLGIIAAQLKDGRFRTQVIHRNGDGKPQRAMIELHATFELACARLDTLKANAVEKGWTAKEKKAREPKAPAFIEIPTPAFPAATVKPIKSATANA